MVFLWFWLVKMIRSSQRKKESTTAHLMSLRASTDKGQPTSARPKTWLNRPIPMPFVCERKPVGDSRTSISFARGIGIDSL